MNKKIFFVILYLYTLVFSVLKSIRFPNSWAEAHWMLDYKFGFIKRGLAGEILGFFVEKNESVIVWVSGVILGILYLLLLLIAVKQTLRNKGNRLYTGMFYIIFFLSQYLVYSAHLIGYLDHIIFLLGIFIVQLILKRKILLPSILLSIGMVIHEISFFLILPVSVFALIVSGVQKNNPVLKDRLFRKSAIFLILPMITVIGISLYEEIYGKESYFYLFNYLKNIRFIGERVAGSVASAYTEKLSYYFTEESPHLFQRLFISTCTILCGVPLLFLCFILYKRFYKKTGTYLLFIALVVIFFPLLLNAIAWDTYRIWSFPYMIIFIVFGILNDQWKDDEVKFNKIPVSETIVFFISILLVGVGPNILMDDEVERFSFSERIIGLLPIFLMMFYYYKSLNKNILRL